jgi:hypothetical protein
MTMSEGKQKITAIFGDKILEGHAWIEEAPNTYYPNGVEYIIRCEVPLLDLDFEPIMCGGNHKRAVARFERFVSEPRRVNCGR